MILQAINNKLGFDAYSTDGMVRVVDNDGNDRLLTTAEQTIVDAEVTTLTYKNKLKELQAFLEEFVNAKAKEYRYSSMVSVRSYVGYPNRFQAECLKLSQWSSAVWEKAEDIEVQVLAGNRTIPTQAELVSELPIYTP